MGKAFGKLVSVLLGLSLTVYCWMRLGAGEVKSMHDEVEDLWAQVVQDCQIRGQIAQKTFDTFAGSGLFDPAILSKVQQRARAAAQSVDPAIIGQPEKLAAFTHAQQDLSNAVYAVKLTFQRHPHFKDNPDVRRAEETLEGADDRVFGDMTIYNRQARQYDAALARFPGTVVGPRQGLSPKPLLKMPPSQQPAPARAP